MADSETAPPKLPRLEAATGSKPRATSSQPAMAVRFRPRTPKAALSANTATARTGPYWFSTARQTSGSKAYHKLARTTAPTERS